MSNLPICIYQVDDKQDSIFVSFRVVGSLDDPEDVEEVPNPFQLMQHANQIFFPTDFSVAFAIKGAVNLVLASGASEGFRNHTVIRKLFLNEAAACMVAFYGHELQFLPHTAENQWPPTFIL